jgi:hypothetical protein
LRRFCYAFAAHLLHLCCAFAAPCCAFGSAFGNAFAASLRRLCYAFNSAFAAFFATPLRRLCGAFAALLRRLWQRLCYALAASLQRLRYAFARPLVRFLRAKLTTKLTYGKREGHFSLIIK